MYVTVLQMLPLIIPVLFAVQMALCCTVSLAKRRLRNDAYVAYKTAVHQVTGKPAVTSFPKDTEKKINKLSVKNFVAMGYGHAVTTLARFVPYWGRRIAITTKCDDKPRSGRKSKLPDGVAEQAINIIAQGFTNPDTGAQEYFKNIDHARRLSSVFNQLVEDSGMTEMSFLRRLKQQYASLGFKRLNLRKLLTPDEKSERITCAAHIMNLTEKQLLMTFYVDHKKMYLNCRNRRLLVVSDRLPIGAYLRDPLKCVGRKQDKVVLSFYAMVNALEGPVGLVFVTGTTGKKKKYMVSGRNKSLQVLRIAW